MTHAKKTFSSSLFTLFLISCCLVLSVNIFAQGKTEVKVRHKTAAKAALPVMPSIVAEEKNTAAKTVPSNEQSTYPTRTHIVTLGIGQSLLFGRYSKNGEDKITADLYYAYRSSYTWDFIANVHQSKHKKSGRWAKIQGLALGIRGNLFHYDQFVPFVMGGLGLYRPQIEDGGVTSQRQTVLGWNAGAGVELQLQRHFAIGLIAHLHNPFKIKADGNRPKLKGRYAKCMMTASYIF